MFKSKWVFTNHRDFGAVVSREFQLHRVEIRPWIKFLVNVEWNYVTLGASINLGVRWRWSFYFIYINYYPGCQLSLQKIQDWNTPRSHSKLAKFHVPFFDFGDNKLWKFFCCNLNTTFHILGIFLGAIVKFIFLVKRFTNFFDFVEISDGLGLEDLAGMFSRFLRSISSTNGSWKGEISLSQKAL